MVGSLHDNAFLRVAVCVLPASDAGNLRHLVQARNMRWHSRAWLDMANSPFPQKPQLSVDYLADSLAEPRDDHHLAGGLHPHLVLHRPMRGMEAQPHPVPHHHSLLDKLPHPHLRLEGRPASRRLPEARDGFSAYHR